MGGGAQPGTRAWGDQQHQQQQPGPGGCLSDNQPTSSLSNPAASLSFNLLSVKDGSQSPPDSTFKLSRSVLLSVDDRQGKPSFRLENPDGRRLGWFKENQASRISFTQWTGSITSLLILNVCISNINISAFPFKKDGCGPHDTHSCVFK